MKIHDSNFIFVGNHAAIDFINTLICQRGEPVDLLADTTQLIHWAHEAGYAVEGELTSNDLLAAKTLRSALNDLFLAGIQGNDISNEALSTVNQHLEQYAQHELLQLNTEGELALVPDKGAKSVSALLAALAYEGAQLLASKQLSYVKRCSNPECVLLFLDTSRTRKRRWCSMEICGNRAKVAKHYHKQGK